MAKRMTRWDADTRLGLGFGIGLMVIILVVDVGMVWLAARRPLGIGTFIVGLAVLLSLGLLAVLGYWAYGLASSVYLLDRNELIIRWGPLEQVIPMGQVERVLTGDEVEGRIQFYGGIWPGHCVGYGEVPGEGPALFYATVPPRYQIYVVTPALTYGLSPADYAGFLESMQKRLEMGPTQAVEQSSRRPGILEWPIWRDRLGLILLGAGSLAVLALIGVLCFRFPSLPMLVPLHYDVMGAPDRLGPKAQVFITPLIGLLALLLNGMLGGVAYRRERMVSYLLWAGAILVQVLAWTAAAGILAYV